MRRLEAEAMRARWVIALTALATAAALAASPAVADDCDVRGTKGPDVLHGAPGQKVCGFGGDDVIHAADDTVRVHGGQGIDTVDYGNATSGVVVNLNSMTMVENVSGSPYADTITGTPGPNRLLGRGGPDVINGRGGNDQINGGPGNDVLNGGAGTNSVAGGPGSDSCVRGRMNSCEGPFIVVVTVDGLRGGNQLRFDRLAEEGSFTLNARTAYESTMTLPNHTSILTGRRVGAAAGHHVWFNDDNGSTLGNLNGRYIPGIFDRARAADLATGLFAGKDKFRFLIRSWGRSLTHSQVASPARNAAAVRAMWGKPSVSFWHLASPDVAGHTHGWNSPEYLNAVAESERQIHDLLDLASAKPGLRNLTTIIVTSDHGGRGWQHAHPPSSPDNFRVPFYVWGGEASAGRNLYAINPKRENPASGRPNYSGPQPVRNLDAANLVMARIGAGPLVSGTPTLIP